MFACILPTHSFPGDGSLSNSLSDTSVEMFDARSKSAFQDHINQFIEINVDGKSSNG